MSGRGAGGSGRQSPRSLGSPHTGAHGARFDDRSRGTGGNDFVICGKHNTQRKAIYCVQKPVYDADHNVVRYQFECKESESCTVRSGASNTAAGQATDESSDNIVAFDLSSSSAAHGKTGRVYTVHAPTTEPASSEGTADVRAAVDTAGTEGSEQPDATTAPGEASTFQPTPGGSGGGRGAPARYYDVDRVGAGGAGGGGGHRGGAGFPTRKVCWNCGLPGHEKPDCPNGLCRACHGKRRQGEYHHCVEITPSDLFAPDLKLPQTADGMPSTKCLYCGEMGHMDCSASPSSSPGVLTSPQQGSVSCAYCGRRGHTSYDCGDRSHQAPDRYAMRQQQFSRPWNSAPSGTGGGGYAYGGYGTTYDPRQGGGGRAMAPTGPHTSPPPSNAFPHHGGAGYGSNHNYRTENRSYVSASSHGGSGGGFRQENHSQYTHNNDHRPYSQQGPTSSGSQHRQSYASHRREGDSHVRDRGGYDAYRTSSRDGERDRHRTASSSSAMRDRRGHDAHRSHRGSPTSGGGGRSHHGPSHDTRRAGRKRFGSSDDDEGPLY